MKYIIKNKFHNTQMMISIDDKYSEAHGLDVLDQLSYEIYSRGDGATYARRIEAEIKKVLCGQSGCHCGVSATPTTK